jgi:plastocyanin domain-containing protein
MEAISYIYASVKNTNSTEAVVVFDDISVNALEQINSIVLPVLVSEGIKAMI